MTKRLSIRCPQCSRNTFWHNNPSRPFCSERCRLIDLGRWDNEEYAVAGKAVTQDDDSSEESA
ncbi:MAG: DNA gyrase inhibitor YacG [Pelovirga sp.]